MANKRKHMGIIRHTVPTPTVFYGSVEECAKKAGVCRRGMVYILAGRILRTNTGWMKMTEDEYSEHYQPPKPVKHKPPKPRLQEDGTRYPTMRYWKISIFKDWQRGDPVPKEQERKFLGTMSEVAKFLNCQYGQVLRMVNTYLGEPEKYKMKSLHGWRIYRVRKHKEKKILTVRVWDKDLKKMVYKKENAK